MIAERLEAGKIVFGLAGDLSASIDTLCSCSTLPDLAGQFRAHKPDKQNERYSYIGDGIAVPHLRIDNLAAPELILGLSPDGLSFNGHQIKIVLLLATPAEQPAQHLQLLQRICSVLPAVRDELLSQRNAGQILKIIARAEQQSALPTYLNLT
ncbi:MAG: PTS sugar transporter subunit IIA, partial [Candidatus Binatia bacterium]